MSRVVTSIVKLGAQRYVLAYDLVAQSLVSEISDYGDEMAKEWSDLTLHQEIGHLRAFMDWLLHRGKSLSRISDTVLKTWRDDSLTETKLRPQHRGSEEHARKTTNAKLWRVYHWLHWLQLDARLPFGTIGPKGAVMSELFEGVGRRTISKRRPKDRVKQFTCPLEYKLRKANSKHRISKFILEDVHIDEYQRKMFERYGDTYLAQRNSLFVALAHEGGLRRGSINSLTTEQFAAKGISECRDEWWVQPPKQKFNYINSFPLPIHLAVRVRHYIDNYLEPFLAASGIPKTVHQDCLFLSVRSGAPLKDRSIGQIVSEGFRDQGAPVGVGSHALRRKFSSDALDEETEHRREEGLDTSGTSISLAMSLRLGQADPMSHLTYVSANQSKKARARTAQKNAELERLKTENSDLKVEVDALKKELGKPPST